MKPGDMVCLNHLSAELLGVVLKVEHMEGIWKDSCEAEPVYTVTVLFDKDVPTFIGSGRIAKVTDMILKVIQ